MSAPMTIDQLAAGEDYAVERWLDDATNDMLLDCLMENEVEQWVDAFADMNGRERREFITEWLMEDKRGYKSFSRAELQESVRELVKEARDA